ncbi:RecQ family ATP-dependent DNA helicase [Peribacillus glennii]|uniref:ATP-dependent DNA helicase RecQ n=1 Tax=Peribacillus glennii TaxID=2303991 RepID=A0A372LH05_9BACI|nr:RecQ family ATP-dependent DNA helicase [Peribacillus glennii]RFU65571.1 ATP-dependent DNA helicase RecQ [Peribacillus glennii]
MLEESLYEHFGFTTFRPGQKEIIASLLDGHNTLGMLPTGSGKSLCYQLTAYLLQKPVVIVSPLLSLMQDQAEQLRLMGEKSVLALNSFLDPRQKRASLQHIKKYRFIFLSPEMLAGESVIRALKDLDIGLFVIDEAHCISQWGYDFRPDYLSLGHVRKKLSNPLTLALTATATKEVREDIEKQLCLDYVRQITSSVDRGNIALAVETLQGHEGKLHRLLELAREIDGPGIVYFSSKKAAEHTAIYLKEHGIENVAFYHGGMEQEQRIIIQRQFLNGQLRIICSTSAFGMGVNKEDVRFVVHFHLPSGMEAYVQEIGRAGRDGKQSVAIILYSEGDEGLPLHLFEQELPTEVQLEGIFSYLNFETVILGKVPEAVEETIIRQFSLNETQWRFIKHFIRLNIQKYTGTQLKDAMKRYVAERREYKTEKLHLFFRWLGSNGCLRNGLLRYFDEEPAPRNTQCCTNCGLSRGFTEKLQVKESGKAADSYTGWKQELAKILLKAEDSHEK